MTIPDPAWRIKTRPCPFYQHGRCLFADSCNFLHNVSVKASCGIRMVDSGPRNHPSPPLITVDSPRSISSSRSPRISGLLDALKDVIGEDSEEDFSDMSAGTTPSSSLPSLEEDGVQKNGSDQGDIEEEVPYSPSFVQKDELKSGDIQEEEGVVYDSSTLYPSYLVQVNETDQREIGEEEHVVPESSLPPVPHPLRPFQIHETYQREIQEGEDIVLESGLLPALRPPHSVQTYEKDPREIQEEENVVPESILPPVLHPPHPVQIYETYQQEGEDVILEFGLPPALRLQHSVQIYEKESREIQEEENVVPESSLPPTLHPPHSVQIYEKDQRKIQEEEDVVPEPNLPSAIQECHKVDDCGAEEDAVPNSNLPPLYPPQECHEDDTEDDTEDDPTIRVPLHSPRPQLDHQPPRTSMGSHEKSSEPRTRSINRPAHLNLETVGPPTIDRSLDKDDEVFIDSGYAESWHSPVVITPPRRTSHPPRRNSTLNFLGSPFGSPSERIRVQDGILGKLGLNASFADKPIDAISDVSLDCPRDCDSPRHELERASPRTQTTTVVPGEDAFQTSSTAFIRDETPIIEPVGSVFKVFEPMLQSKIDQVPLNPESDEILENSIIVKEEQANVAHATVIPKECARLGLPVNATGFCNVPTAIPGEFERQGSPTVHATSSCNVSTHVPGEGSQPGSPTSPDSRNYTLFEASKFYSNRISPPGDVNGSSGINCPPSSLTHRPSVSPFRESVMPSPGDRSEQNQMAPFVHPDPLPSPESCHPPSPLDAPDRFSALKTPPAPPSARHCGSSRKDSTSDVARRMSLGWKRIGTPSIRSSDPPKSNSTQCPIEKRLGDAAMSNKVHRATAKRQNGSSIDDTTSNRKHSEASSSISIPNGAERPMARRSSVRSDAKTSGRKHVGSASPTYCPSCGCAPFQLPPVVSSPFDTAALSWKTPNGTSISHQPSYPFASTSSLSSSVSSAKSPTHSHFLFSPARNLTIPQQDIKSIPSPDGSIPSPLSFTSLDLKNFEETAPPTPDSSTSYSYSLNNLYDSTQIKNFRFPKKTSESSLLYRIDENGDSQIENQHVHGYPIPTPTRSSASASCRSSYLNRPSHAIATPKPTLFFAIASDDVDEVRKVLESGEAGPNETVGPQSALEFVLANNQLMRKTEIIKLLLAYGANPSVVKPRHVAQKRSVESQRSGSGSSRSRMDSAEMDPATRYFLEKAGATETQRASAMMRRSSFRAATRIRYEIIGQDRVLEQLFKVLSIHTRRLSATPIVVLLSGPSGHGKSLLARKFGSLLDVPTHIVNMTTLKSTHDLWRSYSMTPINEATTTRTLAEFLMNNEGKRCVVVLDEIEKTDEKVLWSLLMPWELGRCSTEAGSRHIDVRNVVWIGTSNIGQDIVFEYQARHQRERISQEEYSELMGLVRPKLSEQLGNSVLSRVTAVLPFVPFTLEERRVICYEAMYALAGEEIRELSPQVVDEIIKNSLASYRPMEGARSLYNAISNQLAEKL